MRLRIFATHPVQYHVALWRELAATPGLDIKVFYFSDQNVAPRIDPGFGVPVSWDVPLLQGYEHEFLMRGDLTHRELMTMEDPEKLLREERADWVMLAGYTHPFERQLLHAAHKVSARVI